MPTQDKPAPLPEEPAAGGALVLVGRALDAVDAHTAASTALHAALSAGFFALSREQASSYAAALRLSSALHDQRAEVSASLRVRRAESGRMELLDTRVEAGNVGDDAGGVEKVAESGLRRRKGGGGEVNAPGGKPAGAPVREKVLPRHSLHAMPSAALREAAESFERAVAAAVSVANAVADVDARMAEVPI
jgi:hypothetical protein